MTWYDAAGEVRVSRPARLVEAGIARLVDDPMRARAIFQVEVASSRGLPRELVVVEIPDAMLELLEQLRDELRAIRG